jgi:hypothetical protein
VVEKDLGLQKSKSGNTRRDVAKVKPQSKIEIVQTLPETGEPQPFMHTFDIRMRQAGGGVAR